MAKKIIKAKPVKAGRFTGFVLFFMAAVVPLVVRYVELPYGPDQYMRIVASENGNDFFSYYKSMLIVTCAAAILIYEAFDFYVRKKRLDIKRALVNPPYIAAGVFIIFALLSAICTAYKYTALNGANGRYESLFVFISYMVIFFGAMHRLQTIGMLKLAVWGMLASSVIIGVIGAFQFFGKDPYTTDFVRGLVMGEHKNLRYNPMFTQVYATLFNPNCVGAYSAMMLPFSVFGCVYAKGDIRLRIAFGVNAALMSLCLVGCLTAGGIVGAGVSAAVALAAYVCYFFASGRKKKGVVTACAAVALILAGTAFAAAARGADPQSAGNRLASMAYKVINMDTNEPAYFFRDLVFDGNAMEIYTARGVISVSFDRTAGGLSIADGNGNPYEHSDAVYNAETGYTTIKYSVPGLGDFEIINQDNAFVLTMYDCLFIFTIGGDGSLLPVSKALQTIDLNKPVRSMGFEGREHWATDRGYIWSRTFPVMLDSIIVGHGPDAFALVFPQDDIVGKTRFMGDPYITVDKPHNMYLMHAVNTGIVSMLALLFLFAYYIVKTFMLIVRRGGDGLFIWGMRIAVLAGVCGFLTASLTTDSTVSVSPVFWMMLGIGYNLNARGKETD